jgi:hypothetical protein
MPEIAGRRDGHRSHASGFVEVQIEVDDLSCYTQGPAVLAKGDEADRASVSDPHGKGRSLEGPRLAPGDGFLELQFPPVDLHFRPTVIGVGQLD